MADFNLVTSRLATGAAVTSDADVLALKDARITHIIDCRDDVDDAPLLNRDGLFHYVWNGVPDDGNRKEPWWFLRSIQFAVPALAQSGTVIYAHCHAGVNRGPSTAYAIMLALGWESESAFRQIQQARPKAKIGYAQDALTAMHLLGYPVFTGSPGPDAAIAPADPAHVVPPG
jgi:hypothetical protein